VTGKWEEKAKKSTYGEKRFEPGQITYGITEAEGEGKGSTPMKR